jgi:ABC-type transport system involved in multi-copper enzyme maturation permease subunit
MTATNVRRVVLAVCVLGIAGMIVSSIAGSTGAAMTFGLITAVAVLCSIVATAVTSRPAGQDDAAFDDLGARLEAGVAALVDEGASEPRVRAVVADAVRFGRLAR